MCMDMRYLCNGKPKIICKGNKAFYADHAILVLAVH
jgi:hypothetical protein